MADPGRPPAGGTLVVFHLAEVSGPSASLRHDLAWLASGGPVDVLVPGPGRVADQMGEFARVLVGGYGALTLPRSPLALAAAARRFVHDVRSIRRLMRRLRPARVVVVTTSLPAPLLAARAEGVPALVYAGEVIRTGPGVARRLAGAALRRLVASRASAIVACSRTVADQFAGSPARVVEVAYPPVGEPHRGADGPGFRARLGVPADVPCVLAVGALTAGRGQDLLVSALPTLLARFPELRLVLAGSPHPRAADQAYAMELRSLAARLGVAGALVLTPHVDRPWDAYAAADVVVNPSWHEGFGRVATEALAAGRPVVATDVEAVPEVLRDGVDALLVPPGQPASLAGAIARLLEDESLARGLTASGAERVRTEFTQERASAAFAAAVRALDARAPHRSRG